MKNKITITPEQRIEYQKQAKLSKEFKSFWAEANLRNNYKDRPLWADLASKVGLQLPIWYAPASEFKYIRRFMRKVGKTPKDYNDLLGFDYKEIATLNPDMPAYAAVGLFLECAEEA